MGKKIPPGIGNSKSKNKLIFKLQHPSNITNNNYCKSISPSFPYKFKIYIFTGNTSINTSWVQFDDTFNWSFPGTDSTSKPGLTVKNVLYSLDCEWNPFIEGFLILNKSRFKVAKGLIGAGSYNSTWAQKAATILNGYKTTAPTEATTTTNNNNLMDSLQSEITAIKANLNKIKSDAAAAASTSTEPPEEPVIDPEIDGTGAWYQPLRFTWVSNTKMASNSKKNDTYGGLRIIINDKGSGIVNKLNNEKTGLFYRLSTDPNNKWTHVNFTKASGTNDWFHNFKLTTLNSYIEFWNRGDSLSTSLFQDFVRMHLEQGYWEGSGNIMSLLNFSSSCKPYCFAALFVGDFNLNNKQRRRSWKGKSANSSRITCN